MQSAQSPPLSPSQSETKTKSKEDSRLKSSAPSRFVQVLKCPSARVLVQLFSSAEVVLKARHLHNCTASSRCTAPDRPDTTPPPPHPQPILHLSSNGRLCTHLSTRTRPHHSTSRCTDCRYWSPSRHRLHHRPYLYLSSLHVAGAGRLLVIAFIAVLVCFIFAPCLLPIVVPLAASATSDPYLTSPATLTPLPAVVRLQFRRTVGPLRRPARWLPPRASSICFESLVTTYATRRSVDTSIQRTTLTAGERCHGHVQLYAGHVSRCAKRGNGLESRWSRPTHGNGTL